MNNDPGEDKQNPNEINHNASLAEKRGEPVVENGEKEPASGTSEKSSGDILKEEKIEETEVPQEFSRLQELCAQAGIEVMIATIGNIEILTSEEIKNISLRVQEALRNFTAEQLNEIHQKGVNRVILDKDNTGTRILGIGADFYIDRNTETSEIVNFIKENILGIRPETQTKKEASGYKIGDKIRFRNITGTRTIEGEIQEILESGEFKVFDSTENRFYNIKEDQIEEKLSSEIKLEEPKQDTETPPEKITREDGVEFEVGSEVEWTSGLDNKIKRGKIFKFGNAPGGVPFANISVLDASDPDGRYVVSGVSLFKLTLAKGEPAQSTGSAIQSVAEPEQASVPEWRKGPEWQAMEEARGRAVMCRAEYEKTLSSDASEEEKSRLQNISNEAVLAYGQSRKAVEQKIREQLFGVNYDNLSPEEKKKFDSGVKLKIMEEIYLGEAKAFRQAQEDYGKEKKEGGILNSAKEAYAKVLSNKAVKGYLGIKWYYRIPATTLLLTLAGYGLGMAAVGTTVASAAGFAGARMARGALTIAGGSVLRGTIHKGGEKLKEKRKELLKDLSEQNLDELETMRTTRKINERYDRIQKWVKGAKVASAFGVAGAGMWAGMGSGKAAESVADAGSSPAPSAPAGEGFFDKLMSKDLGLPRDPSYVEEGQTALPVEPQEGVVVRDVERVRMPDLEEDSPVMPELEDTSIAVEATKPEPLQTFPSELPNKLEITENYNPENPQVESVATTGKVAEGIFDKPEELTKIKVEGNVNSNWRVIEKGFEQNEKFRNFAEQGQKDIVVNYFVNKAVGNPKLYDFVPDERFGIRVEPGQEVDLSKLLSDKDEIEKVLDNAASKTPKQLEAVAEQREKIEAWLKKYPDKPLTKDAVAEILAEKVEPPKVEVAMPIPKIGENLGNPSIPDYNLGGKISELYSKLGSSILRDKFSSESEGLQKVVAEIRQKAEELNRLDRDSAEYKAGVAELENKTEEVEIEVQKLSKQLLQGNKNIQEMAQDLAVENEKFTQDSVRKFVAEPETSKLSPDLPDDFETKSAPDTQGSNPEDSLRGLRSFKNDTEFMQELQTGINRDLDGIYAKKGLFGGIKVRGALSPEFLQMANKPAGLVMQYAENPRNTTLDTGTIDMIEKSSNHQRFINMVRGLRETVSKVRDINSEDLKPFDNENMQSYHRRLGEIMLKSKSRN